MEAIKDFLKLEKETDLAVKGLFVGMNYESSDDTASLEDYEDLVVPIEQQNLAEVQHLWSNLNKQKVESCDKSKIQDLKLVCCRCLGFDFEKLDAPPKFEDYTRVGFVKSERIINTKLKDGRNEKIVKGSNYFFKCECCDGGVCIAVEEEIN